MTKPRAYILVGVPGSGKSTWIAKQPFDWDRTAVISTDGHVEQHAQSVGKTYSEVFHDYMPTAVNLMAQDAIDAIQQGKDIVWDQTSTTAKTRARKLRMIPDTYEKIAVVFPTPEQAELTRRLNSRPGKHIPDHVMKQMKQHFVMPSESEGFDRIITVE